MAEIIRKHKLNDKRAHGKETDMKNEFMRAEGKNNANSLICKGLADLRIASPRCVKLSIEEAKDVKNSKKACEDNAFEEKGHAMESLSRDVSETKGVSWGMFGLKPEVLKKIDEMGYAFPSPVQAKSIPHALNGRCLLVRSKNGTGKTASYMIPILNNVDVLDKNVQAIIVVPIRELALQVARCFRKMYEGLGILSTPVVGGTNMQDDIIRILNGVHVMIGTPGRIVDLIEKKVVMLSKNVMLVFDEADKLLDVTFGRTITRILELMPRNRQMMLYSATFPYFIAGFMKRCMQNPLCINLMTELVPIGIKQFYVHVKPVDKLLCLKSLFTKTSGVNQCVVFCNNIKTVEFLAMKITEMGMPSYFIHSKMAQEDRNAVFHSFLKEKCKILVATDLITRGIDAPSTNYVINFDLPKTSESYLHRIGRAGRFGRAGVAISFVSEADKEMLADIETNVGSMISPLSDSGLSRL